jgi:hypothetical protein
VGDTTYGGSGTDTAHNESGDRSVDTEQNITVEIPDTARTTTPAAGSASARRT